MERPAGWHAAAGWHPTPGSPEAAALAHVAAQCRGGPLDRTLRVTLNFHPDRLSAGVPILVALAHDGVYRSQFETGTSNGGLTAHPGGDRWQWESRLFGGAYDAAPPARRPKYGALDYRGNPMGASPRFGSAHLRLRPSVLDRCTFCYPDSVFAPVHVGIAQRMELIELAHAGSAIADPLDDYIEAHVHGPLELARDVEALVLDPCYRGTAIEEQARALPCEVRWHAGFRLGVEELRRHPDYRGDAIVQLGLALARGGVLTPDCIGAAARDGRHDPQDLKKVWHYLARFGVAGGD
ncbi:DUF3626 domain-containing protein [Cupriavidus sp. AU9028]|uniref:DUF3626 domain-containing protein n=1 Tax=Cupriavidus sp. AU9028 TaxID=2871157 RepID=UPI001C95099B|nr:DUF3626 domain-containing protein [Cupriavidus sp. AU9028]MBY4898604.1 DUF3626 domain-containing protein [Cupriavidus sp. AU9028]